jgi:hypothetical protein
MASRKPSTEIPAKRAAPTLQEQRDAQFQVLLRNACIKAAGFGALSALVGALPGAGVLLRFAIGELADVAAITAIQEQLIEDTLTLYELPLPDALRRPLIAQISALGAGASIGVDAIGRRILGRFGSKIGGTVFGRVAPLVGVLTSAVGNAATTYAIGRRAEAFAKVGAAPADSLADVFRAFTGLDERRVWDWSVGATKDALATLSRVTAKLKMVNPFARSDAGDFDPADDAAETADADAPAPQRKPRAAKKAASAAKSTRKAGKAKDPAEAKPGRAKSAAAQTKPASKAAKKAAVAKAGTPAAKKTRVVRSAAVKKGRGGKGDGATES